MEAHTPGAPMKARDYAKVADEIAEYANLTPAQMAKKVKALEKDMYQAARDLEFERAAAIRDQIKELRGRGIGGRDLLRLLLPLWRCFWRSVWCCLGQGFRLQKGDAIRVRGSIQDRKQWLIPLVDVLPKADTSLIVGERREIVQQHRQVLVEVHIARFTAIDNAIDLRLIPVGLVQ
jgi:hypothetical protein